MPPRRRRMTGAERRDQLIDISRGLFAAKGLDGTSIEEIAAKADVSKPVVYEHFGSKEGLYAVVVDREVNKLLHTLGGALSSEAPRELLEEATCALLTYVETEPDGFRILTRDSYGDPGSRYRSIIGDMTTRVEDILLRDFERLGLPPRTAPMYAQMLVGAVAQTGLWWLDTRKPAKRVVVTHVVNLVWNGLSALEPDPHLRHT